MSVASTDYSDVDSFASVEMNVAALNHAISELYGEAEELEEQLLTMERPLENTQLSQLGQLPFLESSPFRHAAFKVKPPGIPGVDCDKRYPFHTICTFLRNYLIEANMVLPNGDVCLNTHLQQLFGIKESVIGYVYLIGRLRQVIV